MAKQVKITFAERVRQAVEKLGECTNRQVLQEVAEYITAARACRAAHLEIDRNKRRCLTRSRRSYYSSAEMVAIGKRHSTNRQLAWCAAMGKIVRVRKGLYRPVGLRLYKAC